MGRVFRVGMLRTQKPQTRSHFSCSVASVPLPPTSPIHWRCQTHPCVSLPLPSPPLLYLPNTKKGAHVACFLCLALLHLSPPAENEKCAQCGAFFVFSTCAAPLTPSASPLVPLASRLVSNTENTCGCVLCVWRALFLCPRVEHRQHTHVSVLFVFGTPCASPLTSNTSNTPTLVCSLCSVLPVHPPSHWTQKTHPCECVLWCSVPTHIFLFLLVTTTLLGKFLFR